MPTYIALLRAVNVGGTGKLPMEHLRALCGQAGYTQARTYIASGNVVFESMGSAVKVKTDLEAALLAYAGRKVGVLIRTGNEMAEILSDNPFPAAPANKTMVIFLDAPPPANTLSAVTNRTNEETRLGRREIYVYFPDGAGASKLRLPASREGTARNMNTVRKLTEMARQPMAE